MRRAWPALLACVIAMLALPVEAAPARRIVALAPGIAELVAEAGAADRLVGVTEYSDFPEAVRRVPRIGDAFRVDEERIVALRPDLVLVWGSGTPAPIQARLRNIGLPLVTIETRTLAEVATTLRAIGRLAGTSPTAEAAAGRYKRQLEALASARRSVAPLSVFVEVGSRPIYTVTDRHMIGEMVRLCGGRNVFGDLPGLAPTVGLESVIAANPEVILALDDDAADARVRWRRWPQVRAVANGRIYAVSSDLVARASTRAAAGAAAVCAALDAARLRR